jgi:hypothetical protein
MTAPEDSSPSTRLRAMVAQVRSDVGDDPEIVRQAVGAFFALDQQNVRNHFEGRLEYTRQVSEHRQATLRGLVEYGLQTLKWLFLLNAGAIALVMAYVGGVVGKSSDVSTLKTYAPFIVETWPFVIGCVLVAMAGAAAFFNFTYSETTLPSAELLHNFLGPDSKKWPVAKFQKIGESPEDFTRRWGWKVTASRNVAIGLAFGSASFFVLGVVLVMRAIIVGTT